MKQNYLAAILLIERLHRHFLDVIKSELDRLGTHDVNNVQSLILYNIGGDTLTVGELTQRGYYLGSNVSYNLKKLVENGYLEQERSEHDRRSVHVRLSSKGLDLCNRVAELFDRQAAALEKTELNPDCLRDAVAAMRMLERFWSDEIAYGPQASPARPSDNTTARRGDAG